MSISSFLRYLAGELNQSTVTQQCVRGVTRHAKASSKIVTRNGARYVARDVTPLLVDRGWQARGNIWRGSFATQYGTFDGQIERRGDVFNVLIKNPPAAVKSHSRWACFHQRKNGWWSIHLHDNPCDGDPSAIIAYVERLLAESFAKARRRP